LWGAQNEAYRQPFLNWQLARTYLAADDPLTLRRTWQMVMEEMTKTKQGSTRERWLRAIKDKAFDSIRDLPLLETKADHFWNVLVSGKISTNVFLRRISNFALDMNWLPWPVIAKRQWPKIHFPDKRAITREEHQRIVQYEHNVERKAFYQLAWHLGASQSDLANLQAEDVDRVRRVIVYRRIKLHERAGTWPKICYGSEVEKILGELPPSGPLFPYLSRVREADRATEFRQRCLDLHIQGVTLHSYRYAWAQRARECGYPERFAQNALGHNSKAVHWAYARRVSVTVPALEEYERIYRVGRIDS